MARNDPICWGIGNPVQLAITRAPVSIPLWCQWNQWASRSGEIILKSLTMNP